MPLDEYQVIQFALKVGAAILVFLIGRWLARRARRMLGVALAKTAIPPSMARLLLLAVYYVIMLIVLVVALSHRWLPGHGVAERLADHRSYPGHRAPAIHQ